MVYWSIYGFWLFSEKNDSIPAMQFYILNRIVLKFIVEKMAVRRILNWLDFGTPTSPMIPRFSSFEDVSSFPLKTRFNLSILELLGCKSIKQICWKRNKTVSWILCYNLYWLQTKAKLEKYYSIFDIWFVCVMHRWQLYLCDVGFGNNKWRHLLHAINQTISKKLNACNSNFV